MVLARMSSSITSAGQQPGYAACAQPWVVLAGLAQVSFLLQVYRILLSWMQ